MENQTVTVIYGESVSLAARAEVRGDALWMTDEQLEQVSGWRLKPEGLCRGEICVPVPAERREALVEGELHNLTALAQSFGQPLIRDHQHRVWCFGAAAAERKRTLTSLQAPDFALPDLKGRTHALSDYQGRKILLASWASW